MLTCAIVLLAGGTSKNEGWIIDKKRDSITLIAALFTACGSVHAELFSDGNAR